MYLILCLIVPCLASSQIVISNSAEEANLWLKKLVDLRIDQTTTLINYADSYAIINEQLSQIWVDGAALIKINDDTNEIKMNQTRSMANEQKIDIKECEDKFKDDYWSHRFHFNDVLSYYTKEIGNTYYIHYNRLKGNQETFVNVVAQFETEIYICDSDTCFEQLADKMRPEYGKGNALFKEIAYYSQEFNIMGAKDLGLLLDSTATFMRQTLECEDEFEQCANDKNI